MSVYKSFTNSIVFFVLISFFVVIDSNADAKAIVELNKRNPFTNLDFNNSTENFQFVILADRAGETRRGIFAEAIDKVNLLEPEFVISVGDFVQGYSENEQELSDQWE